MGGAKTSLVGQTLGGWGNSLAKCIASPLYTGNKAESGHEAITVGRVM